MSQRKTVRDLKPAEYNPRKMNEWDAKSLAKSIKELGDLSCVVFNIRTGNLVGGHQRVNILREGNAEIVITEQLDEPNTVGTVARGYILVGDEKFPYREVDWDLEIEKIANLAANRVQGEWDEDKLAEQLYDIKDSLKIRLAGFQDKEVAKILAGVAPTEEVKAEVQFTEELMESHNYVVLYFDNDVDWLQLQTLYPLATVKALDSKPGYEKKGVGRVVRGVDFIRKIQEGR